jgi:hypothetical protein
MGGESVPYCSEWLDLTILGPVWGSRTTGIRYYSH